MFCSIKLKINVIAIKISRRVKKYTVVQHVNRQIKKQQNIWEPKTTN